MFQGTHCTGETGKMLRKTQGIWKFCQTQGIWFAQVVSSLILKVKDISIFAMKIPPPPPPPPPQKKKKGKKKKKLNLDMSTKSVWWLL